MPNICKCGHDYSDHGPNGCYAKTDGEMCGCYVPVSELVESSIDENAQHVYHHSDSDGARVNVKIEKNTKGYNWEATVTGAKTVDEAIELLKSAEAKLQANFGPAPTAPVPAVEAKAE